MKKEIENSIEVNYKLLMQEIDAEYQSNNGDYHLRIGATTMKLRINCSRLYCELPGLYVGEVNASRLIALYYGLTGKTLIDNITF